MTLTLGRDLEVAPGGQKGNYGSTVSGWPLLRWFTAGSVLGVVDGVGHGANQRA